MPTLNDLRPGQSAVVEAIAGDPALVQRLYEFGLCEGETIEFLATAPLGDPIEIRTGNTRLSLRKSEAAGIQVRTS
ncbi:MAG: ferrous iron transport protein A [Planctomycetia bacterium]|nr:ferrous iron transport protein A [Planctomycetia bacterium]